MSEAVLKRILAEIDAADGEISVLWKELNTKAVRYSFQSDKAMSSASLIKVPIMLAILNEVEEKTVFLEQKFSILQKDILSDSRVFEYGPRECSLEELLTWMIILSDNTSTNFLIEVFGMDCVNAYCQAVGLKNTCLRRKMLDTEAAANGRDNLTTAEDAYILYEKLCEASILTPALCKTALDILERQQNARLLRRYIWEDVSVAHKTGGLDNLSHDTGVFRLSGRAYFLGVLIQKTTHIKGNPRLIGRISRIIYDYYINEGEFA